MPSTEHPPPRYMGAFAVDYRLQANSKVRKNIFHRSRGSVELATEEPPALDLSSFPRRPSTTIMLKVLFKEDRRVFEETVEPYSWTFTIETKLKRTLILTTKPFDREPTLADAKNKSQTSLYTKLLLSERREYSQLAWRNEHTAADGTLLQANDHGPLWTTRIPVAFTTAQDLVPSFLCPTFVLRYSVLVSVRIGGLSGQVVLETPLQVYCQNRSLSKNIQHCELQASEDLPCLNRGNIGEDTSLEVVGRPPKYRRWAF
ncbi:hypothetical protein BDV96DRAFT_645893 [Lophiotrema nucula]|uniref:Arrestin-like N-terminal domain-containing protein n=1 Tax=Lophiotrema nucula TaxID=690887 RepID=A0A6A5Z9E9_9PLEO|nr:hypothetical protein BDV96DRAFT_645893 [Lophiotrema nucula]